MGKMKSPLIIIAELLTGLIGTIGRTLSFVIRKLGELALSLLFFSTLGPFGVILAIAIGAIVFLLVTKFIFKTSRTLLAFAIALVAVVAILALLWLI